MGYDYDKDPLWHTTQKSEKFDRVWFYHCDHLGTPQEMSDQTGVIVWTANYKAWGQCKPENHTKRDIWDSEIITNNIRFQGQYYDDETGLHYNRYRYYLPYVGRFISKDPIGLLGGNNIYAYAPNPVGWIDPLGLHKQRGGQQKERSDIPQAGQLDKNKNPCKATISINEARRLALLKNGIPVSSQPIAQRGVKGWEQYLYKVGANSSDVKSYKILSHHQPDTEHKCGHWHVGIPKRLNSDNRPEAFDNGSWKYQVGGITVEHETKEL